MISLDTNILVYSVDVAAKERHTEAKRIIRSAAGVGVGLTEQCLLEFVVATTRKTGVALADASAVVRKLLANFPLWVAPNTIVVNVLDLIERYPLAVWDARILACCAAHGCDYLLSEDMQDGASYGGVTVVNPFKPTNRTLVERLLHI